MTKYDDLFDDTAPTESVFRDKGALDPLTPLDEIIARDEQEHQLARILNGVPQQLHDHRAEYRVCSRTPEPCRGREYGRRPARHSRREMAPGERPRAPKADHRRHLY